MKYSLALVPAFAASGLAFPLFNFGRAIPTAAESESYTRPHHHPSGGHAPSSYPAQTGPIGATGTGHIHRPHPTGTGFHHHHPHPTGTGAGGFPPVSATFTATPIIDSSPLPEPTSISIPGVLPPNGEALSVTSLAQPSVLPSFISDEPLPTVTATPSSFGAPIYPTGSFTTDIIPPVGTGTGIPFPPGTGTGFPFPTGTGRPVPTGTSPPFFPSDPVTSDVFTAVTPIAPIETFNSV